MGDSEEKPTSTTIPDWQRESADSANDNALSLDNDAETRLDVARRFLADSEVASASRSKKAEFLRSKGIEEADIELLLAEANDGTIPDASPASSELSPSLSKPKEAGTFEKSNSSDRPPVVTYPEFLAKPARPPPLVTSNGLLHTFNAFAILSTVLYGASKFIVEPMVDNLTSARLELHDTASSKLDALVMKLEQTVSVVPPSRKHDPESNLDSASDDDDPSEMFHRDVGTQTSFVPTPAAVSDKDTFKSQSQHQVERLSALPKLLSGLKDDYRSQSEDLEDVKTMVDVFRDDLDSLTYGGQADFVGGYDAYSRSRKNEPDDEIKKARDNIRKVKGVLLSTRNFPMSSKRV